QLRQEYTPYFAHVYYTIHPRGLVGEMQCKSANQSWAARWYINDVVKRYGLNLDNIVITTMDADTRWHEKHFEALTFHFATSQSRHLTFWQAPIRYHGNIWQ